MTAGRADKHKNVLIAADYKSCPHCGGDMSGSVCPACARRLKRYRPLAAAAGALLLAVFALLAGCWFQYTELEKARAAAALLLSEAQALRLAADDAGDRLKLLEDDFLRFDSYVVILEDGTQLMHRRGCGQLSKYRIVALCSAQVAAEMGYAAFAPCCADDINN